jgi:hypothetical protein
MLDDDVVVQRWSEVDADDNHHHEMWSGEVRPRLIQHYDRKIVCKVEAERIKPSKDIRQRCSCTVYTVHTVSAFCLNFSASYSNENKPNCNGRVLCPR